MQKKYLWIGGGIFLIILVLGFIFAQPSEAPTQEEIGAQPNNLTNDSFSEEAGTLVQEFIVEGNNFSFLPNSISVKKGETVRIIFKATEGFHDLVIDGYKVATKQLRAPDSEILEFVADQAGNFEYYCSVGTHRAMGMVGTLIVEE